MKNQGKVAICLPGRVLIRNQPCWHLILTLVAFRAVTVKFGYISHPFHGILSWRLSSLRHRDTSYVFPHNSSMMSFVLETNGQILSGAKAVSTVPTFSMALAEGRGGSLTTFFYGFPYSWHSLTAPGHDGPLASPSSPLQPLPVRSIPWSCTIIHLSANQRSQ